MSAKDENSMNDNMLKSLASQQKNDTSKVIAIVATAFRQRYQDTHNILFAISVSRGSSWVFSTQNRFLHRRKRRPMEKCIDFTTKFEDFRLFSPIKNYSLSN